VTEPVLAAAFDSLVPAEPFEPDWVDVLVRAEADVPFLRRRRNWYALAVAAIVIGLLVSPAFGLGGKFLDLFTGSPAPEHVKTELSFGTNQGNDQVDELMRQHVKSTVLVGQARGLLAVPTSAGLLHIWGAPTSDGGLCTYMLLAGAPHGWLACDTLAPDAGPLVGTADAHNVDGRTLRYVSGQARERVVSVELKLEDGSVFPVRKVGTFFFRALAPGQQPAALVGKDGGGSVVAELPVASGGLGGVLPPVSPVGPRRSLFVLQTRIGKVTMHGAAGPEGKRCWIVTTAAEEGTACRDVPRGVEFDFNPYYNSEQTERIVLLSGFVGPQVDSLQLRFEDGSHVDMALKRAYFLYGLPRRNWEAGHRPSVLVARDGGGKVIARRDIVPDGL
jgi:hypothetical protein